MTIQRAVVKGTLFGVVQVRNMFTASVQASGGDTPEILWTAYLDSIYTEIEQLCVEQMIWTSYEIQEISGTQWETIDEVTFEHEGGFATDSLPNAVALVLLGKATGIKHVGRKFFSGLSETYSATNTLVGGAIPLMAAALLAYVTPFTGIGGGLIQPGVVSSAGTFHPFVGGSVSSLLGSMRRRKPGLGI